MLRDVELDLRSSHFEDAASPVNLAQLDLKVCVSCPHVVIKAKDGDLTFVDFTAAIDLAQLHLQVHIEAEKLLSGALAQSHTESLPRGLQILAPNV